MVKTACIHSVRKNNALVQYQDASMGYVNVPTGIRKDMYVAIDVDQNGACFLGKLNKKLRIVNDYIRVTNSHFLKG